MISTWSEWKRYPRPGRGENIVAPITPGLYEVRYAGTGALHSFEAVDNVAQALAQEPAPVAPGVAWQPVPALGPVRAPGGSRSATGAPWNGHRPWDGPAPRPAWIRWWRPASCRP